MFRFIDRKQNQHLVIIAGWAFDYRIFNKLDLPFNYFFYTGSIITFEQELKKLLKKNNFSNISLLGWSQGAFAACDFAGKNPDRIKELILISVHRKYKKDALERIEKYLIKNRTAYLYKFYKDCFYTAEQSQYSWFKENLLKDYLEQMSQEQLINELHLLARSQIQPERLEQIENVKIIHGREDAIAPLTEAMDIAKAVTHGTLITFKHTGHLPFLHKDFNKRLYEQ